MKNTLLNWQTVEAMAWEAQFLVPQEENKFLIRLDVAWDS